MRPLLLLNVVGLTPHLLGAGMPRLARFADKGAARSLVPPLPAVTCTVQASMLTGLAPAGHGAVANGWYFRDLSEVLFWRQSNRLITGEWVWEAARRINPAFRCAQLFWWYNMYATADITVTPRPMYPADGRKIPDLYTRPPELREALQRRFGQFPLFHFWGPAADIRSSRWIANCALDVFQREKPTLTLVYLPHLDYDLQRFGPNDPRIGRALGEIDEVAGELIAAAERAGAAVIVLSEYGITPVDAAVFPNRRLRQAGLLTVREEMGRELLDAGASAAFAVCDHQLAHVYVQPPATIAAVRDALVDLDGVAEILDADGKRAAGLDHPRAGELVLISRSDRWFAYPYWLDDRRAPDFARTVDIHRKPGYDPVELFLDPALLAPRLAVAWRLLQRKLGFRTLMDVIPLDTRLVRGSHGRLPDDPETGPLLISSEPDRLPPGPVPATAVKDLILSHLFGA